MSRGIGALSNDERSELEEFFGAKLSPYAPASYVSKLERVLDLLEALWMSQALKERQFEAWFREIRKVHMKEVIVKLQLGHPLILTTHSGDRYAQKLDSAGGKDREGFGNYSESGQ